MISKPRTTLVLTVAMLLAVMAAACSSSSDDTAGTDGGQSSTDLPACAVDALAGASAPVEVVVWHSYVAKTKDTLEKLADEYNRSQDKVRVRVESQGNSYEELWGKYQQAAAGGGLPAIAIVEDTTTQAMVDSGTVLPAQSCIDADDYDTSDLVQSGVDYYTIDDVMYPGTVNMSSPLLYFNANHFRAAGLDPSDPPTTLDELHDAAKAIKDAGVAPTPLVMNLSSWYIETWLTGEGAPMVDNENGRGGAETTEAAFDDDQTLTVMQWIKDMYTEGLLQAIPVVPGKVDHLFAMQAQTGSMTFETSTAATSIKAFLAGDQSVAAEAGLDATANVSGLDIQAAKIPGVSEPGQVQMSGGAWYMTAGLSAEVQAAAWDFLKWWNSPETQIVWTTEGSYIPFSTTAAQSPEVQQFWRDDLAGRWSALSYQQLSGGVDPAWPGPLVGPYKEMRDAIEDGLDSLTLQGAEPQAVIDKAAQTTDDAITSYNQGNF